MASFCPSSIGLTARVHGDTDYLEVTALWGRYAHVRSSDPSVERLVWLREQRSGTVSMKLVEGLVEPTVLSADDDRVVLRGRVRRLRAR